ncbi:sacsin N-terminal ATP-binding-like domain-containing protein [Phenylobacterium sp.]|uniref:sacsin N-terminal ATP-binding-like domain-containing protein n=1 Tax=Phenylobacterium sp. TaxID=1871053 RepID=UPI0035B195E9
MADSTDLVMSGAAGQPVDATSSLARTFLEDWARRKVRGFEGTIDEAGQYLSNIYQTAASISEQIAADYHGRFLIELIQNAHDVHSADRDDGRIEVLFDAGAGPYGTLYVANGGQPFTEENVKALSDLGLSSKPPGQAIGNKGLGFRSVQHVCDAPEIYSQADGRAGADRFGGFCFRFAGHRDLERLMSGPRSLELAVKDLPPFHVPVWLEAQSDRVREFSARGFATVIALPLRDDRAVKSVADEIESLRGLGVPILLFLSRLASLDLRVMDADGIEAPPLSLTRHEMPIPGAPSGVGVVDLGPAGRHLIARRNISEEDMLTAIAAGIEEKQLHSHWATWKGEGEAALAVRLDGTTVASPRLFTFLPMGEQAYAPFPGYLHASFFPSPNRKGLEGKVRLNGMLLEVAADLAATTVAWLARCETSLSLEMEERARAAVDLLCWRRTEGFETFADLPSRVATGVVRATGVTTFADAPVAPVLAPPESEGPVVVWRRVREARRWTQTGDVFGVTVAARHAETTGAWPLWPGLGQRIDGLVACFKARSQGYVEAPLSSERAQLATRVAADLHQAARFNPKRWSAYYKDLVEFVGSGGAELADMPVLLNDGGGLSPAMSVATPTEEAPKPGRRRFRRSGRVAVFAPPARRGADDEENDLAPPSALAENFAFLSERLDWYGELADARAFFVRHKLILEFDRESILTQLARVLREDTRNASRSAGLRWAFQIWRRPQGRGRSVTLPPNLRLFVPTAGGDFIPADEAVFSDGWPEEMLGRLVQRLIDAAPPDSPDLEGLAHRRLAKPDHYAMRVGTPALWAEFLEELGVQRGLHPRSVPLSGTQRGDTLMSVAFWRARGLTEAAHAEWSKAVAQEKPAALTSYSLYSISGELRWMPGQWDLGRFDREALECFSLLIIAWLAGALPEDWEVTIRHSTFNQADKRSWPTPLKVLLRQMAWIPAQQPSSDGAQPVVVKPSEIWMAGDPGDRFPPFLRRPTIPVMRALERAAGPHIAAIRRHTGLRTFDQPNTLLAQAAFLADQFAKPGFEHFYDRHLANLYAGTWQRIADHHRVAPIPAVDMAPIHVLARRGDAMEVFKLRGQDATDETVYVRDVDDETGASLVEAAGQPMLEIRAGDKGRLGEVLQAFYGERVRLLSEADYSISVDGREVGAGAMEAAVDWCPRLPLMMAVAMEGLKGLDARTLPVNRQVVLERLARVMVQPGARLGFRLDDLVQDQLEGGPEALNLRLPDGRAVVVVRTGGHADWMQLDRALGALCDALGQPGLEQGLRILLRSLASAGAMMDDLVDPALDPDFLCDSLRLTERARRVVRETLGSGLERHVPWVRALLYMAGGQPALDDFAAREVEAVQDPVKLRATIAPWLPPLGCDAQAVLDACRSALTVAELREALGLDFHALNEAMLAIGQAPDTYPDVHARQLAGLIRDVGLAINDALRAVAAPLLNRGEPAPAYARARDTAATMAPDPDWLLRYREVPDPLLITHVDKWLEAQGASPLGVEHPDLEPLEDVRRSNGSGLKALVGLASPLVSAWCGARGEPVPAPWSNSDGGLGELRTRLDQAGVIDFRALDQAALHVWIERLGAWPQGMERTLDGEALKLADAAIAAAKAKAEAEAAARRKQARSIDFNGTPRDPEETDWASLDAELARSLPKSLLRTPLGQPARLAFARPLGGGSGGGGASGGGFRFGGGGGQTFAPSAKTEMIGRLGELAVRHWLQARLPKQDIRAAWVSGNAELFTGRKGDDGLGYDFEVSWQRQTWWIEVKASLNDPRAFELGETEVRAGRVAARARSGLQYWIAYVSNLSTPGQARIELIPNPLSEAGEAVLELAGEGLRYRFRRA